MEKQATILELIATDSSYARHLYELGIPASWWKEIYIKEACASLKLDATKVYRYLKLQRERLSNTSWCIDELQHTSIGKVITLLKYGHSRFVQKRLPFLDACIRHLTPSSLVDSELVTDLQLLFPIFAKDFIQHIREEEGQIFVYIQKLASYQAMPFCTVQTQQLLTTSVLGKQMLTHHLDDDDMEGLRYLTQQYDLSKAQDVLGSVVLRELQAFDLELQQHAAIENEVLFVKAVEKEKALIDQMDRWALRN